MLSVKKFRQRLMDNEEVVKYNVNNYDSLELMRTLFDYKTFIPTLKAKYAVLKSGAATMGDSHPNGHVHLKNLLFLELLFMMNFIIHLFGLILNP